MAAPVGGYGAGYDGPERCDDPRDSLYQKEQDAWQRELEREVALAIGRYLIKARLLKRRVETLSDHDLVAIGAAACAEYSEQRERKRLAQELDRQAKLIQF